MSSVAVFKGGVLANLMPPLPSDLQAALDKAQKMVETGNSEKALGVLRDAAWDATKTNSHKARVLSAAADAYIARGESDPASRRKHWQAAHKNYQKALKMDSSNKDIRRDMNRLASMMDEQAISLGSGFQILDDGSPTPLGVFAIIASLMVFLVAFKVTGGLLEQPSESVEVTMIVSYVHPDDPNNRVEGTIVVELYPDDAPKHVESFLSHVENFRYDSTVFHRVIDGFMIQGGDIEQRSGSGGYAANFYDYCNGQYSNDDTCGGAGQESWTIPGEHENGLKHGPGALAAAHAGLNTDGSQFYIVPSDSTPSHLDWEEEKDCSAQSCHTVFGMVVSGQDVVDAISEVDTPNSSPQNDGSGDTPIDNVRLISVTRN